MDVVRGTAGDEDGERVGAEGERWRAVSDPAAVPDAQTTDALTPPTYTAAVDFLAACDPVLAGVAARWTPRHPERSDRLT